MSFFRTEKKKNFTVMSNYHLRDKNLSFRAKGLLSMILSLPDDWSFSIAGLVAISKEGKDAVMTTLKELEAAGYIIVTKNRSNDGRFKYTYDIYEIPQKSTTEQTDTRLTNTGDTDTGNPKDGVSNTENSTLPITDITKTNIQKTEIINTDNTKEGKKFDPSPFIEYWNLNIVPVTGVPEVRRCTPGRVKNLKRCLKQFTKEEILEAFDHIKTSAFLQGQHNNAEHMSWIADFDFMINPEHIARALEGKYDDRVATTKTSGKASYYDAALAASEIEEKNNDNYHICPF